MDLTKLRKLESPGAKAAAQGAAGSVTAIVKVKQPGYRPEGVKVRGEISENMFTADIPAENLTRLEEDPGVESIAISRPLQSQSA